MTDRSNVLGTLERAARRMPGPSLFLGLGVGYFLLAQYTIRLNDPFLVGAGFWPAAGLAYAALLLTPTRLWGWGVAATALAEFTSDSLHGYPMGGIPWWTAGNAIEPLLGALLVRRFASPRGELVPLRHLLAFIALAVVVAPLVGATIGSVGTLLHSDHGWWDIWTKYVIGDALGVLVVAPVFLTFRESAFRRRALEAVAVGGATLLASLATLVDWPGASEIISPYLVIPVLTWGALRFGIKGAAWLVFLLAQVANVINAYGYGPFVDLASSDAAAVTLLQVFLLVAASSTFILAALVNELSDRDEVQGLLRGLADSMPQLVWVADSGGNVEYFNRRSAEYYQAAWPLGGRPSWGEALHPDDRQRTAALWAEASASGGPFECEHRVRMVDGAYRWHLTRAERVAGMQGFQWYGTSTDIHDLKEADELKDQFLAIASHELRNPVGAIHGMAQQFRRAQRQGALTEERLESYTDSLVERSAYLARLTSDLLDVSRLQRGTLPLHREETDLREVIAEVVESGEWPPGRIRASIDGALGVVFVDPVRVRQAIANLLDNALKYSSSGEVVDLRAAADGDGVVVQVKDRGIGLSQDALELVFKPFGRAVNTGSIPGLGMGLYIAREIVERHGGRLWATSDGEGQGTTMHLWLPAGGT